MPNCQGCQIQIRFDYDRPDPTTRKPYTVIDVSRELPHVCKSRPKLQPNPIPRYDVVGGIEFDRKETSIALAITKECLRCGLDPFKVRIEVRSHFLILH